ncbi:phage regulatory CII family protein [Pseudomonas asplenii]|uniref:Phage regulatory protein CII (CP76) n=1 Tax=Pseudomonas asplenii TaxID=53407 RepID=A0A1H6NMT7_9PSED|nr:phage regulatory CII family protein [Pseudomonas fuscovaginae]SEI17103.1 hypothetical protein SAMN05216581_3306 [Pseudomonas fuscovaginae]
MDEFLRACQSAVLDNEAKVLAGQMGVPHVSLLQRANPDNDAHHLTIEHLFGILLHTQDMRPLLALADQFGFDLVPREKPAAKPLMVALARAALEFAEVTVETHSAMADGRVDQVERARVLKEIAHTEEALATLKASVKVA